MIAFLTCMIDLNKKMLDNMQYRWYNRINQ